MIQNITINNFKSLHNIKFDLPKFALIVGYNAAGKTNLFTAIKLISVLTSGKQIDATLDMLNILPSEFFFDVNSPTAEFALELTVKSKSVRYSFEIKRLPTDSSLSVGKETLYIQGEEVLNREGNSFVTMKQDNNDISKTTIVNNQLAISIFQGSKIVNEVKQWLSQIVVDTFEPILLKNYGLSSKTEYSLSSNLAEKIYFLKNNKPEVFTEVISGFKKVINGLESLDVETTSTGNLILKFKDKDVNRMYRSFSASNGNLRTMGIILALYGEPKLSAIFIDEIENALHPSRIDSVINSIRYLSQDEQNPLQVVMTTHNPVVLDYVSPEQIVYCFKKGGETFFVNPYKNESVMYELKQSKEEHLSLSNMFATGLLENIFTNDIN